MGTSTPNKGLHAAPDTIPFSSLCAAEGRRVWESRRPSGPRARMCLGGFAVREAPSSPRPGPGHHGAALGGPGAGRVPAIGAVALPPVPGNLCSAPAPARHQPMSAAPAPRPRHTPGELAVQRPRGGRPGAPVASAAAQRGDSASRNVGVLHGSALKAF